MRFSHRPRIRRVHQQQVVPPFPELKGLSHRPGNIVHRARYKIRSVRTLYIIASLFGAVSSNDKPRYDVKKRRISTRTLAFGMMSRKPRLSPGYSALDATRPDPCVRRHQTRLRSMPPTAPYTPMGSCAQDTRTRPWLNRSSRNSRYRFPTMSGDLDSLQEESWTTNRCPEIWIRFQRRAVSKVRYTYKPFILD